MANALIRNAVPDFTEASDDAAQDWGTVGAALWNERANWRLRLKMALADKEREARLARGEGSTEDILAHIGLLPVHMIQGLPELPAAIARSAKYTAGASGEDYGYGTMVRDIDAPDPYRKRFVEQQLGQEAELKQGFEAAGFITGAGGGKVAPVTTNRLVAFGKAFGKEPAGLPEAARIAADRPFTRVVPAAAELARGSLPAGYSGAAMTAAQMDDIIRGMGYDPRQLTFNQKSWLIQRERTSAAPGPEAPAAPAAVGGGEEGAPAPVGPARGGLGPGAGGGAGDASVRQAHAEADLAGAGEPHLEGLPRKPIVLKDKGHHVPGPSATARKAARDYMAEAGLPYDPPKLYHKVEPEKAGRIAQAFEEMPHAPEDPAVQASYDALINETLAQWEKIKQTGLKVEFNPPGANPYELNPRLAMQDIRQNNHLWVYPTSEGFGTGAEAAAALRENPMLRPTGEVISGQPTVANDIFRIVHDYFGHYKEGVGFRAEGEENAWKSHSAMYSEQAKPAMTSETRGQNSWVNFGPHAETNKTASGADTHYAPQKIGLMPEWTLHAGGRREAAAFVLAGEGRKGLYSKALQVAEQKLPKEFTPAQAIATLKQAGLKAEELGPIEAHLQSEAEARTRPGSNLPPKMSKQDLLDHIHEGIPEIKERWYGGKAGKGDHVSIDEDGFYQVMDEDGYPISDELYSTRREAEAAMEGSGGNQPARFTKWTLEGGENKRNLLLQDPASDYEGSHWNEPGEEGTFAHARLDDRKVKVGGKSVDAMHVDEVQSDLHQEGRKKGYNTPEAHAEFERLKQAEGKAYDEFYNEKDRIEKQVFGSDYQSALVAGRDKTSLAGQKLAKAIANDPGYKAAKARWEDAMDDVAAGDPAAKPPPAPFQKSEAWTALTWKRLIQEAVANGKDWVTWTTGKIQNDRYRMSNQISSLHYDPVTSGTRTKYVLKARTSDRGDAIAINNGEPIRAADLSDFVGQELADRIVKGEGDVVESGKVISDLDVNVGGKGMEGYYDDMTPKILKKLFGKYGVEITKAEPVGVPARVDPQVRAAAQKKYFDTMTAATKERDAAQADVAARRETDPEVAGDIWRKYQAAEVNAKAELLKSIQANKEVPELHAMSLTPALKEASQGEGFTLYAGGRGGRIAGSLLGLRRPLVEGNKLGFSPDLRVRVPNPRDLPDKPLITQTTTNRNAPAQLDNIDLILAGFPNATHSALDWSKMMAHAFASDEVPVPPYAFIRDIHGSGAADKISSLTPGQITDADHGFAEAAKMRQAYESGRLSPVTTGKLFFWSFLSRGVSPYTQESLFIDAFGGINDWIQKAARGEFTKKDLADYKEWAASTAPKGSGQPGSGALHNLNAFGTNFLLKMAEVGEGGISKLQRLHNMLADPDMTGQQIRREFLKFGEGVGIDNKVVSFTLLVAGHKDVMIIDRVQTRQLWDDGRFANRNIYDGQKVNKKVVTGTALSNLTYGARGLLIYEAIERGLSTKLNDIYTAAGRPQDASVGRFHWDSWVAHSQQEASHGTLGAIMEDVRPGRNAPAISTVSAKEGEYGAYAYGARYARDENGTPYFSYTTPVGHTYEFSVPAFRTFLADVKGRKAKVVPKGFKVTESGNAPWYEQSGVNTEALDRLASSRSDRGATSSGEGAVRGAEQGQVARGPPGRGRSTAADWERDPIVGGQ